MHQQPADVSSMHESVTGVIILLTVLGAAGACLAAMQRVHVPAGACAWLVCVVMDCRDVGKPSISAVVLIDACFDSYVQLWG